MDVNQNNVDLEVKQLFGITDEGEGAADTPPANANPPANDNPPAQDNQDGATDNNPPASDDGSGKGPVDNNPPAPNNDPAQKEPPKDKDVDPEEVYKNKQNQAFAKLRTENKASAELIMKLATAMSGGQAPKDLAEATALLNNSLTNIQAKNQNIPAEVLKKMEEQDREIAEYRQAQAKQRAMSGFQQVKSMYGLSNDQVNSFVDKLIEQKIDPFKDSNVDLVKEYRNIYYDELIKASYEKGVQEERARSAKAQTSSTNPGGTRGVNDNTGGQGDSIKSVRDLDSFLDSLGK